MLLTGRSHTYPKMFRRAEEEGTKTIRTEEGKREKIITRAHNPYKGGERISSLEQGERERGRTNGLGSEKESRSL